MNHRNQGSDKRGDDGEARCVAEMHGLRLYNRRVVSLEFGGFFAVFSR
jgi:hypothetical protein